MLSVRNLSRPGLSPVTFDLTTSERVVLQGPSGSGKTLLLRALADLDPTAGAVSLDGQDREAMSGPQWRRQVVYVPAEPGWWAERPADHFAAPDDLAAELEELLLPVDILARPLRLLSTGERQRLALLRALLLRPPVLLLDEPTSALDAEATAAVERRVRASAAAVIWVTHNREQAERLAGRRLVMSGGRLSAAP